MAVAVIDTPNNVTGHLSRLKANGVQSVGRYIERENPHSWKVMQPAEYHAIVSAGLNVFFIYEYDGKPGGSSTGAADGTWCSEYLSKTFGVPLDGTVDLVYTYDYDPTHFGASIAAATAFRKAADGFKIWAYAGGGLGNALFNAHLIDARWITCSGGFLGTHAALDAGHYEMHQYKCDTRLAGLDVDLNVMRDGVPVIGWAPT